MTTILENEALSATHLSFEEFLRVYDGRHAEWVDGEVQLMSPATLEHQDINGFLEAVLRQYVEEKDLGLILSAPFAMRLEGRSRGREPDLLFVATANEVRLRNTFLDGPADLVVEIISPESGARDRGDKFYEYEAGGVREYWLLDPLRQRAEWYQRDEDGLFKPVAAQDGVYRSREIAGLWLREAWLWQRPKLIAVLREWGLI